jgi:division protein CdvB (Snf7/Vps24/ESCRT-III family)
MGITTLRENVKLSDHVDVARELGAVRSAVDHLDSAVNSLVGKVVGEVREQQTELLRAVQAQFDRQVAESREVLRNSMVRELGVLPLAQDQTALVNRLLDLVTDALTTMGHFQRVAIEDQSQAVLERVEERISGAIGKVGDEVHEIREKLRALEPASFPALESGSDDGAA